VTNDQAIRLPCSCGKKDCTNEVRIHPSGEVWVNHVHAGGEVLIYSSRDRLHTFGLKLARSTGIDHVKRSKKYREALEAIFHSGDHGTFEHRTAAKALGFHHSSDSSKGAK
jgi:hypothetical protein